MIIAMFGNQGEDVLILFSGTPWGRFCSEGRKHSIVNGQSFRLPIERPRKPLSEVRCFTPFWVIQGDVIALSETPQPLFKTSILSAIMSP